MFCRFFHTLDWIITLFSLSMFTYAAARHGHLQKGGGYGPQGPPGPGGNPLAGGAGAPMGAATGGGLAGQAVLPSLHETDMSIRADPRVMRMTVGALPNSSSAHAQVCV